MKKADNFNPAKWLVENKLTSQSKLNENKSHTASSLLKMFKEKDLVNDRREYDEEDLMKAYPGLSKNEAKKLVNMLSKLNEIERTPDTDYEDFEIDPKNQPDEEEADLLAASIMKKGASIPGGYEDQTYLSDTLVGEDGKEFVTYYIYDTYEKAFTDAFNPTTGFMRHGVNIYTLDDKYAVTFPDPESKSEFYGKFGENQINEESYSSDKILELVKMYVANFYDGGFDSAEIALEKIDKILDGNLDDYDKAFLKGEEDNY